MSEDELEKFLNKLHKVNPENLKGKEKRLFEAIMKIADERDYYKQKCKHYEEVREYFKRIKDCDEEFEL